LKEKLNIYYWASDLRDNTGEGVLANQFLSDIQKKYKNYILININKNKSNYHTFYNKYFLNFLGAILLWKYYYRGQKTMYINYLPIWNFLIFLILPPKTILGPITGSILYNKYSLLNTLRRGFLLNIFNYISFFIIFFKYKKILLSTELLKSSIKKKLLKRCYFNYALKIFSGFFQSKYKKNIDFLFYHRLHSNKNSSLIEYFIKNTLNQNYKIIVVGDPINLKNVRNMGYISRDKIKALLAKTKYTFGSLENLYTLFLLDSISRDVYIFFDKRLKIFNTQIKYNKMLAIDFNNNFKSLKFIVNHVNNPKKLNMKNFLKKNNYEEYFRQYI
jgi:hypothetical protein